MISMKNMKSWLIYKLGGYTKCDLTYVEKQLQRSELERDQYKIFAESIYRYKGSYPAWKAQQEYREAMMQKGYPISKSLTKLVEHTTHIENVDLYLGRIIDSFVLLFNQIGGPFDGNKHHWEAENLSQARGDDYLSMNNIPTVSSNTAKSTVNN